ncbi:hypothetical protein BD779DRAFT_1493962 [Infundibulicybe gibba]|nr:hypothetical protein BD779DRAFT_1493962 [Infundibulicybe gibba]
MHSWMFDFNVANEAEGQKTHTQEPLPINFIDRIPLEIIDHIIKDLLHNLVAILNCGLVCKSWLAISRHHVFSNVSLDRGDKMISFLELLKSPRSTIHPSWIASLSLAYMRRMSGAPASLSNLETFPSVRALRIMTSSRGWSCPLLTLSASREIHHSFPHLTSLMLRSRYAPEPLEEHEQSLLYPLPPGVRTFRILGRSHSKPILRWLDGQGTALPPIEVFAPTFMIMDDFDILPRILDMLGLALRHLTLGENTTAVDFLAQNTELKSLSVTCLLGFVDMIRFIQTLGRITSRNFERLEFHYESGLYFKYDNPHLLLPSPAGDATRSATALPRPRQQHKKAHEALIRFELAAYTHLIHVVQYSDGPQGIKQRWRPAYSEPWRRIRGLI